MKQMTRLRLFTLLTLVIAWAPVIISIIQWLLLSPSLTNRQSMILLFLLITTPIALFSSLLCFIFYLIGKNNQNPALTALCIIWTPLLVTVVSWINHRLSHSSGITFIEPLILYLSIIAALLSIAFLFIQRKHQ